MSATLRYAAAPSHAGPVAPGRVGLSARKKPLLLLAYLCLNGPQARRSVARQFWPDAANPMNSLSVAVAQLRRAAPDPPGAALIEASELQVRSELDCDAQTFRAALHAGELETAQALYRGRSWLT